jgi:transcriptional regulator with XRE-family HTH domain
LPQNRGQGSYGPMLASQCKLARAALRLGVRELAELADLSPDTVTRFEAGEALKPRTVGAIQQALEAAGVEFIGGSRPGVRMRGLLED